MSRSPAGPSDIASNEPRGSKATPGLPSPPCQHAPEGPDTQGPRSRVPAAAPLSGTTPHPATATAPAVSSHFPPRLTEHFATSQLRCEPCQQNTQTCARHHTRIRRPSSTAATATCVERSTTPGCRTNTSRRNCACIAKDLTKATRPHSSTRHRKPPRPRSGEQEEQHSDHSNRVDRDTTLGRRTNTVDAPPSLPSSSRGSPPPCAPRFPAPTQQPRPLNPARS